jgi:arylsulfatase A-like enzyme
MSFRVAAERERMADNTPNVLFFFTDDQRFDTVHAVGNSEIHTPNMDRLVAQGTTFTHAHIPGGTSGAVCMPSRAMLHTGRTLFHLEGAGQGIPESHTMMGEYFQTCGYNTWGTGKWHNGSKAFARSFSDGAEIFFGGMDDHWNVPAFDYDPSGEYSGRLPQCPDAFRSNEVKIRRGDHVSSGKHSSELFAEAAVDYLNGYDSDRPFFMYLAFMAPHDPRTMPQAYLDMYDPEKITLPPNFMGGHPFDNGDLKVRDEVLSGFPRDPCEVRRHLAEYYAMVTHLDAQMGRVLDVLEATGKARDTIVVFAGDNGLALGQHGLLGKQNMYEHSIRVPLVMCGQGVPKGERRSAHVYLLDVYPTLCELLGVDIPSSVEGTSLVPALNDATTRVRETLFAAYRQFQRMVKDDRFKLIEYVVDGRRTTQLFDLVADPWERHNLVGEPAHVETLGKLRRDLIDWKEAWDDEESEWGKTFWDGYRKSG